MECSCGGQGSSSYTLFNTIGEAEAAGYAVEKAPCVIALKDCPVCKRHSQDVFYQPGAKGKVNLLTMMGVKS
ncbi:hypothetical protein DEEACLCL_00121 [Salmonella phage CRW-SP2]|nr:hypothetical protein DEEACLCL_00121 [Salmonella phage CRW-SP2]